MKAYPTTVRQFKYVHWHSYLQPNAFHTQLDAPVRCKQVIFGMEACASAGKESLLVTAWASGGAPASICGCSCHNYHGGLRHLQDGRKS